MEHSSTSSRAKPDDTVEHGSTGSETSSHGSAGHGGADCAVTVGPLLDGFYVEDDGPGLPEAIREKARRADFSTQGAGGLGLAIVRSVVRLHGGTLRITDARGGGARFEVTGLDVAPEDPASDAVDAPE